MERVGIMVPLRMIVMAWVPVLAIYLLPSSWWGIILIVVAGIIILNVWKASFSPLWRGYKILGPFVIINTLLFAGVLWFNEVRWLSLVLIVLILFSFGAQYRIISEGKDADS